DHKVGRLFPRPAERIDDVGIIYLGANVCIGKLGQGAAVEIRWESANRQSGIGEFKPVRLDTPGIEAGQSCASAGSKEREHVTSGKHGAAIKTLQVGGVLIWFLAP